MILIWDYLGGVRSKAPGYEVHLVLFFGHTKMVLSCQVG
jgi:hypothetical protein